MSESDGSRRPSLTRWLSDKVEGLAGGRRRGAVPPTPRPPAGRSGLGATAAPPNPAMKRLEAEIEQLKKESERLTRELDDSQVTLIGKEAEFKNELQALSERNAELLDKIVKLTQRDRELQAKILDAKFDGTGAKDQAKKLDTDLRDLRRSHKAKEVQIAQLESQVQGLEKEAANRPDPTQAAAETEGLTRRLQEALTQTHSLTKERDKLQSQLKNAPAPSDSDSGSGKAPEADAPLAQARGHLASGPASDPLKAMAAGKRPATAQQIDHARQRQGDAAQKLLEAGDRGFATLPAGFVEALLDNKRPGRTTGEHRASRRGGSKRQSPSQNRGRSRNRSRRPGAGNR